MKEEWLGRQWWLDRVIACVNDGTPTHVLRELPIEEVGWAYARTKMQF